MGLYRRKDSPVWWLSLRYKGGRLRESTGTDNRKLAERILAKRTLEAAEGRHFDATPVKPARAVSFAELTARYLEWARRQRGFRSKKGFADRLVSAFGALRLDALTVQAIEGLQSAMLSAGLAPATANRHTAALKHMYTKAVEWDLCDEAARDKVRRVKNLAEHNRRLRYLSREEAAALVEACAPHLRPVVVCALNTGLRKGEILGLTWEKVDMRHGFILLDVTKNGERREVPINATLRDALKSLVRRLDSPYVFTDGQGRRYADLKRSFAAACRRAGLRDFRFHDLRHTFASQLVMAGVDITTVKELLGHKSLAMTLRYAHLAPSHKVAAVKVLDGHDLVTLPKKEGAAI